jgi:hypothetical protein
VFAAVANAAAKAAKPKLPQLACAPSLGGTAAHLLSALHHAATPQPTAPHTLTQGRYAAWPAHIVCVV